MFSLVFEKKSQFSGLFIFIQELNIDPHEVEGLLVACILDGTIHGKIDQVHQILTLDTAPQGSAR